MDNPVIQLRNFLPPHNIQVIVYHSPCSDGFTAVWTAWKYLGNKVVFLEKNNGIEFDITPLKGKVVLFVDCALVRSQMLKLTVTKEDFINGKKPNNQILVLDHHLSNMNDLQDLHGCYFDLERSGAGLAWNYFFDEPMPRFVKLVQDRDLQKYHFKETKAFTAAFYKLPFEFEIYDIFLNEDKVDEYIEKGKVQLEKLSIILKEAKEKSVVQTILEFKARVFYSDNSDNASEICEYLASLSGTDLGAICYFDKLVGKNKVSLRSIIKTVDVSLIAKKFGGGGHPFASSFYCKNFSDIFLY